MVLERNDASTDTIELEGADMAQENSGIHSLSDRCDDEHDQSVAIPAGTVIHAVKVNVGTAFSGSGIVSTAIDVGKTGSATAYIAAEWWVYRSWLRYVDTTIGVGNFDRPIADQDDIGWS